MKILIVSKLFYPSSRIGAVRPSNFATYLADFGNQVTVITESIKVGEGESNENKNLNIIRVSNSSIINILIAKNDIRVLNKKNISVGNLSNSKQKIFFNISTQTVKNKIKRISGELFELIIEYWWYKIAVSTLIKSYKKNSFDIVISSYGPMSSFFIGRFCKKQKISNYWICDLRDNIQSSKYSRILNLICKNLEQSAVKFADAITFVSNGQMNMFLKNNLTEKDFNRCHVIFNGFEKQLFQNTHISVFDKRKLNFVYTGQIYIDRSDFSMLFEILNDLISEGLIQAEKIHFNYAGLNDVEFLRQISKFPFLSKVFTNHGHVSKEKAYQMQLSSDILVVLAWNTIKEQGILSGKFLEYLKIGKPIISIVSGDLANAELSEMVNDMNLGIACENLNYQSDKVNLRKYILEQYIQKINGKELFYTPDKLKVENFNYENLTKKLVKVIDKMTNNIN